LVKTLDRYIFFELVPPYLLGIIGFILIMITDLLFTYTDLIINKGVPVLVILRLLIFKLPAIMVLTFPVSMVFATSMVLSRMSKENEMIALRTSGVSLFRISAPVILISVGVSFLSYFTNEFLVPWSNHTSENIIRQMILRQPLPEIKENVFFRDSSNRYFYVRKVDQKTNTLEDLMIYEIGGGRFPRVIIAKSAKYDGNNWTLSDGVIHRYDDASGKLDYEANFSEMQVLVNENITNFTDQKTTYEMNSRELSSLVSMLQKGGVDAKVLLTDLYMKISVPVTCLIFALLAIPFSLPAVRSGRAFGLVFCVALIFTFYVIASVFRSFGHGGIITPFAAAWLPNIFFGVLAVSLIIKENYFVS
jgi:lipopolysaccharide export system permease protein